MPVSRLRYFIGGVLTFIGLMILFSMVLPSLMNIDVADGLNIFGLLIVLGNPGMYLYLLIGTVMLLISVRLYFAKKDLQKKDRLTKSISFAAGGLAVFLTVNLVLIAFLYIVFRYIAM